MFSKNSIWLVFSISLFIVTSFSQNLFAFNITYSVEVSNPKEHKLKIVMSVTDIERTNLTLISLSGPEGYAINNGMDIVDISAYDDKKNRLNITSQPGEDRFSPDYWFIEIGQIDNCSIEYTLVTNTSNFDRFGTFYYGYLNEEYGVFLCSYLFLYPEPYDAIQSITLKFQVPDTWKVYTPWTNEDSFVIEIPAHNTNPYESKYFSWSAIAMGNIEREMTAVGSMNLITGVYALWPDDFKKAIHQKVVKIYQALTSIFRNSLDYPYMSIFLPPADDGTMIYGGTGFLSQTISIYDITDKNIWVWVDYAHEVAETRWIDYDFGFVGNTSQWFKAGDSGIISLIALLNSGIIDNNVALARLRYWYEKYKEYVDSGQDQSLVGGPRDHGLIYTKGPCAVFLLASSILDKTNGKVTLGDLNKYLFEKYWGTGTKLKSNELLNEINAYTSSDFSDFFNKYIYGTELLSIDWPNAIEILSNSNTTPPTTPTTTTTAVSSVTVTTASSGGNVTSDGSASVTARGVCWSTSANPTTSDRKTTDGTGTGPFTSTITGLSPGTTYHVRAYATNSEGTGYGSDVSFKTSYTFTLYVSISGDCGDKTQCYTFIQNAIDEAPTGSGILIAQGTYDESIVLDESKALTLQGGWDSTFTTQSSYTTVNSITISNGTIAVDKLVIQ